MMLTESCAAAVQAIGTGRVTNSNLKDASVIIHQVHPESSLGHVFKKGSVPIHGLAVSTTHVFAVQADRAAVNVYNRVENKQEASVFFSDKVTSITIQNVETTNFVILGMANGGLVIWEISNGRTVITNCFHTQPITTIRATENSNLIISGSDDTNVQIWDLARLLYFDSPPNRDPLRAFTQHRSGIADIVLSHGQAFSLVAISAGRDGVCHIWNPTTLEALRTILLNTVPKCLALDPADRALYIGSEDGTPSAVDFIKTFTPLSGDKSKQPPMSTIQEQTSSFTKIEHSSPINCLTISYDSTTLLTGHDDGKIHAWEAGKGKYKHLIADLSHPVTNLLMLHPEGLQREPSSNITIPTIVKPKPAETFSSSNENATSSIPSNYTITAQLIDRTPRRTASSMAPGEYDHLLRIPGFFVPGPFPQTLIDESIADLCNLDDKDDTNDEAVTAATVANPPADAATVTPAEPRLRYLTSQLAAVTSELSTAQSLLSQYSRDRQSRRDEYRRRESAIRAQLVESADIDITVPSAARDALVHKVDRELEALKREFDGR